MFFLKIVHGIGFLKNDYNTILPASFTGFSMNEPSANYQRDRLGVSAGTIRDLGASAEPNRR